jgi:DNA (cytosine-5)-methyltransferase 1
MKKQHIFPKQFSFIDLFAGIGGFRLALEEFGGKCVYSSEWDKNAQDTYEANFGERPDGDITKVDEKSIPTYNVICAGFPCQTFSISGKQKGFEDTRGTLFFDIARIAKHHKPEILFLENVKNFEKHDNGKTLEVVKKTLNEIGYNVFYKVLNASHYGAPTSRQRIYFVCFRKDMEVKDFNFPPPTNEQVKLRDCLESDDQTDELVIERNDARFNGKKVVKNIFGEYPLRPVRIGTFNGGGQGERIYSDLGHAVTFSAYGGGVGSKTGAYLINGRVRKLSPRECARVMGFPEDFKIPSNKQQAYQQFGNSVVVPVLKRIFEQILNTANEQKEYVKKREVDRARV